MRRAPGAEIEDHDGIPTTTVAQTILDLAATGHDRLAERAIARADSVHRYDFARLRALLDTRRGARGTAALRALLGAPAQHTRSELEEAFLAIVRERRLLEPIANLWVPLAAGSGLEIDFAWPAQRLAVEIDSAPFHASAAARDRDARKDHTLQRLGWRPCRFTERQVMGDPGYVGDTVAHDLG